MKRIEPHLIWIGHAGDGRNVTALYDAGIVAVIQLAIEEPPAHLPREFISLRVPLLDGDGNAPDHLRLAIRSVATSIESRIPTLVCCSAGMSRSPAIVAAALAIISGEDRDRMLEMVADHRPADVSPAFWAAISQSLDNASR